MKICKNCGEEYTGRNKYFCSSKCKAAYMKNFRICPICGARFYAPPSSGVRTCGDSECSKKYRSQMCGAISRENMKKAIEDGKNNPNTGGKETCAIAKSWVISSPSGEIYYIDNLKLWSEQHEDLLPGSALHFAQGIRDIKRTIQGKKKRGSNQYKGWHLVEFYEENLSRIREGIPEPRHFNKRQSKMCEEERLRRKRERYYKNR